MRRNDICLYLSPADRAELQSLVADRNTPRKLVWRAQIVLATADGHGTGEIMRRAATSKPTVWRWQERYLDEGVAGLMRDKYPFWSRGPFDPKTIGLGERVGGFQELSHERDDGNLCGLSGIAQRSVFGLEVRVEPHGHKSGHVERIA